MLAATQLTAQTHLNEASTGYTIEVLVTDFDSNKGKVFLGLYNSETSFLNTQYKNVILSIKDNTCTYTFTNVPEGTYAISLYHDENDNGKMDTNIFGAPKEDYGCSNNARGFMSAPKWDDAKFKVTTNTKQIINL